MFAFLQGFARLSNDVANFLVVEHHNVHFFKVFSCERVSDLWRRIVAQAIDVACHHAVWSQLFVFQRLHHTCGNLLIFSNWTEYLYQDHIIWFKSDSWHHFGVFKNVFDQGNHFGNCPGLSNCSLQQLWEVVVSFECFNSFSILQLLSQQSANGLPLINSWLHFDPTKATGSILILNNEIGRNHLFVLL